MAIHPDIPTVAVCEVPVHWLHPELQCFCLPGKTLSFHHIYERRTPSLILDTLCQPCKGPFFSTGMNY